MKKRTNQAITLFVFILLVCLHAGVHLFPASTTGKFAPEFEHITLEDGLVQSSVGAILQDSKGFMWFGTQEGLCKYDGKHFTEYRNEARNPKSLSADRIIALYETGDGMIWIGTYMGGLNRFDPKTETFTRFQRGEEPMNDRNVNHDIVWCLQEDRHGNLWAGTLGGGLNRFNPVTQRFNFYYRKTETRDFDIMVSNQVFDFIWERDDLIRMATAGGFLVFDSTTGTYVRYAHEEGNPGSLSHNHCLSIAKDNRGYIWIGTMNGLNRFDPETKIIKRYMSRSPGPNGISSGGIHRMFVDRDGNLWLGGVGGGLDRYDPENDRFDNFKHQPGNPNSLGGNSVSAMFQSRDGILWFGTNNAGISKLDQRRRKMEILDHRPDKSYSLSSNVITGVYEDAGGIVWVGTSGGGLNKVDRAAGKVTVFKHIPGDANSPQSNHISMIKGRPPREIWFGTDNGLHRLDTATNTFTYYNKSNLHKRAIADLIITAVEIDPDGTIWAGTAYAGINRLDPKTGEITQYFHHRGDENSLSSSIVLHLYVDRKGTLWVGTQRGGLNRFHRETGTFTSFQARPGVSEGISDNDVGWIHEDAEGILWLATTGGGLNRFDPLKNTFQHFTTRHGLPSNVVYSVLQDDNGWLWLGTNRGLARFNPQTKECKTLDLRDGLQGYEYNSFATFKNAKGELFFGGTKGLNVFHPRDILENQNIPQVVFTGFKLFNQTVPIRMDSPLKQSISYTEKIRLNYHQNSFSLSFAALDYVNPAKNQYQYKMTGLHDEWMPLGSGREVSFAWLKPGAYTLRIKGSNNDGLWNPEGVSLDIIITPPIWATWWFRILALLTVAVLALLWHRNRMNRVTLELKTETQLNRFFTKFAISEREQDIMRLILKGKTNRDIEDELFISMATVKKHIYNIYKKIGVKNRLELINLVQRSVPSAARDGRNLGAAPEAMIKKTE